MQIKGTKARSYSARATARFSCNVVSEFLKLTFFFFLCLWQEQNSVKFEKGGKINAIMRTIFSNSRLNDKWYT